jgi:tetratricopeptide (TPR) repeat protein
VYGHAAEHQRWLAAWLHSTHDPGQWRQVAYLFADATILLAWLHFDLEHYEQAAVLYRQCIELADALGDANMRVFSIGRISRTLSECGQHDEALIFADAAQQAAGETALPELRSWLAITRSYIHACTGKGYACRTDIEAAEILLRTPGEPPPPYLEFYGPAYMRKWAGHALLKLGSRRPGAIAAGRQAVDQALSTWASQDVRESGEVMVACAYARRAQNEIPEAAQLAGRAYRVAVTTASPRIGRYVFELRQHLVRYRNTPAVRELDEAMLGRQPGA